MSREVCEAVLKGGTLRWSTPAMLNDPYDIQFDLNVDVDRLRTKERALEKLWNAHYVDQPSVVGNETGALIKVMRSTFPRLTRDVFNREYGEAIDLGLANVERILPDVHDNVRSLM